MTSSVVTDVPADHAAEAAPVGHEEQVSIRVDELIIGRKLTTPIHDEKGLLLLAAGSVITSDFKRLLKQRSESSIQVGLADANRVRLKVAVEETPAPLTFDDATATRLDQMIESGLLMVQNTGPAAKDNIVYHGRKAYNLDRHEDLMDQRKAASESVGNMMKEALRGKGGNSRAVTEMAAQYMTDLADDSDSLLCSAIAASREPSLADHCVKMSTLGMALAVELGLDEDNCKKICVAGLVHDWGMGAVPQELRDADYVLTEHEMFQIRKHPIYTVEMLERMPGIPSVVPIAAYQVHERWNGRGYPRAKSGERIHLFARILGVADVYSALTSPRPQRPALSPYAAMECVVKLARRKDLDPSIVRALLKVLTLFPIGSYVALSDGRIARVIRRNGDNYTSPIVQVVEDADGNPVPHDRDDAILDLAEDAATIVQALPTPGTSEIGLTEDILQVPRPRL